MYNYTIADAHCDTVSGLYREVNLYKNAGHLDICRMKEYKNWLQFFACWVDPAPSVAEQTKRRDAIISGYHDQIRENSRHIAHATTAEEIRGAWRDGKIAAFLTLEGGGSIGEDIGEVSRLYEAGVRLITLTWNANNAIASGAGDPSPSYGVTEFGRRVVDRKNELGMIVDVSHLSERGFWELAEHMGGGAYAGRPFVASHSNSRKICPHPRNLTDEQFLHIKSVGGVTGINLCPLFVGAKANISGIVKHVEHFMSLGGEDNVGLGCDFDGIDDTPSDLRGVEHLYRLLVALAAIGYSGELIEKIAYGNFLRVIEAVCSE
jgi:membrane dipeptidase